MVTHIAVHIAVHLDRKEVLKIIQFLENVGTHFTKSLINSVV